MPSADRGAAEQQYGLGVAREFNGASDSSSFAQAFRNEATLQTYGQFNADWRNVQQSAFQNSNLSALGFPDGSSFSLSGVETPQSGAKYLDFTNSQTGQTVAVDKLGDVYDQQTGALEMPSPFLSQSQADAVPQNYETATGQDLLNFQGALQGDAGQQQQTPSPDMPPPAPDNPNQQDCPDNSQQQSRPSDSGQQGCDDSGQQNGSGDSDQQGENGDSGQTGSDGGSNTQNLPDNTPQDAPSPSPTPSSVPDSGQESELHQIAPGETLWSIAQQDLGGDPTQAEIQQRVQQIAKDNQITDPNKIIPGQTINLEPASANPAAIPAPVTVAKPVAVASHAPTIKH